MKLKSILGTAGPLVFILTALVAENGTDWGLSPQDNKTIEGLLTFLAFGLLGWFGFVLWSEEEEAS